MDPLTLPVTPELLDRAIGVVVASAVGDALGAAYEFGGPVNPDDVEMGEGVLTSRHAGAWTDDTDMAMGVLEVLAEGTDVRTPEGQSAVAERFLAWWHDGPDDVGNQTARALSGAHEPSDLLRAARASQDERPYSCGNGSLMRTGPVALGYLDNLDGLVDAARAVSELTHPHLDAIAVCQLWSLAIADAVRTGDSPMACVQRATTRVPVIAGESSSSLLLDAEESTPQSLRDNGGAVNALRAAWWAISSTAHLTGPEHLEAALRAAISLGGDTDTVAAIAGSLLGASYGASAVPYRWRERLWGFLFYVTEGDLARLAVRAVRHGASDNAGWPTALDLTDFYRDVWDAPLTEVVSPVNPRLTVGSVMALPHRREDAVVSLCRIGVTQRRGDHFEAWLMDGPDNRYPTFVLEDVADTLQRWLARGNVFLHCVRAESRTPSAYAAWLIRHHGYSVDGAVAAAFELLPQARPHPALREALARVRPVTRKLS